MFSLDYLKFSPSTEIDHLELFAGECSVSRGETMDRACNYGSNQKMRSASSSPDRISQSSSKCSMKYLKTPTRVMDGMVGHSRLVRRDEPRWPWTLPGAGRRWICLRRLGSLQRSTTLRVFGLEEHCWQRQFALASCSCAMVRVRCFKTPATSSHPLSASGLISSTSILGLAKESGDIKANGYQSKGT